MSSLDVRPDVHRDIVPVVPLFSAQIRQNPKWSHVTPSSHTDHHIVHLLLFSQAVHGTRMPRQIRCSHSRRQSSSKEQMQR